MNHKPQVGRLIGTAIVAVLIGTAWYLEPVFGGARMDQLGIERLGTVAPSPMFLVIKLGTAVLGALVLSRLIASMRIVGKRQGARAGAAIGLLAATVSFDSAQAGQPLYLIVTDGAFMVLVSAVMGVLLVRAVRQDPS